MTSDPKARDARLLASWEHNAAAWTTAVRNHQIPSRRAGTDAAILAACTRYDARNVLDVGCGEGWLARALAREGRAVLGIDGSAELVAHARNAEGAVVGQGPGARFMVVGYDALARDASEAPGPWDLVVCNFALLGDPLVPLMRALSRRIAPNGRLIIQTIHPWMALGDEPYEDGWREETFQGFGVAFPSSMPWFYRTLGSWMTQLRDAGLTTLELEEPVHPETGRPLSMLLHCALTR